MIANIMAKLRSRIKFATDIRVSILCDDLATLLDIVEAVAAEEPLWRDDELDFGGCIYCDGAEWNSSGFVDAGPERAEDDKTPHTPNCPYRRARELCGMDGAE